MRATGLRPSPTHHRAVPPVDLARGAEVFALWCALTGTDATAFDESDRAAFLARPQVPGLCETPDAVLVDAAGHARRGVSLPLERWLAAVRVVRPYVHAYS